MVETYAYFVLASLILLVGSTNILTMNLTTVYAHETANFFSPQLRDLSFCNSSFPGCIYPQLNTAISSPGASIKRMSQVTGNSSIEGSIPNTPPVANDQKITLNGNGTGSIILTGNDSDGDILTFSITEPPLHGELANIDIVTGRLAYEPNLDYIGDDKFRFKVNDGKEDSANTATVSIRINASDANANATAMTTTSTPTLTNESASSLLPPTNETSFPMVDEPLLEQLKPVQTPSPRSSEAPNNPPVADAGSDQVVNESSVVILDGTKSIDPDPRDNLTYNWTQVAGPSVQLSDAKTPYPTFITPSLNSSTSLPLVFVLSVSDGKMDAEPDAVSISVSPTNRSTPTPTTSLAQKQITAPTPKQMTTQSSLDKVFLAYDNSTYGIKTIYPSDWLVEGGNESDTLVNVARITSPTDINGSFVDIYIKIENLDGRTTNLEQYTNDEINFWKQIVTGFKLLDRDTSSNNTLSKKPAFTIIGTFDDPNYGKQKIMEKGTIANGKVYLVQYYTDEPKYFEYFPVIQRMIDSFQINAPTSISQSTTVTPTPQTTPTPTTDNGGGNLLTFDNPTFGFRLQYPSDWIVTEEDTANLFVRFDSGLASSSEEDYFSPELTVQSNIAHLATLEATAEDIIDTIDNDLQNFELLDSTSANYSGLSEAHKITYTYETPEGRDLKSTEVLGRDNDGIYYDIIYTAESEDFEPFLSIAEKMIDSFRSIE
jgi:hypothetical protein